MPAPHEMHIGHEMRRAFSNSPLMIALAADSIIPWQIGPVLEAAVKKGGETTGGWLFKEEPEHYSFADLVRDGETVWNGVTNALARKNLRNVRKGDRVLYYHTGKERAIVGEMKVIEGPGPDPESDDPKAVVVTVKAVKPWPHPVTLERIKQEPKLARWELVRISRLSVMPVSGQQWAKLEELAGAS